MSKNGTDIKFGSLSWAEVQAESATAPSSRCGHELLYFEGNLYLFGGKDEFAASNELWQYHLVANTWNKLIVSGRTPPRLVHHKVALYERKIFVFGGSISLSLPLWVFDFDVFEWEKYARHDNQPWPSGRHSHSLAVYNHIAMMYGGFNSLGVESNELWKYDMDANIWEEIRLKAEIKPPPLFGHTAVFHGSVMWLYGGSYSREIKKELWTFDIESLEYKKVEKMFSPPELYYHIAIVTGNVMLIFGGMTDSLSPYSGMWRFNFETEEWTYMVSRELPPLSEHSAAIVYQVPSYVTDLTREVSHDNSTITIVDLADPLETTLMGDAIELQDFSKEGGGGYNSVELRPITTLSTLSAESGDSNFSLPGAVLDDVVSPAVVTCPAAEGAPDSPPQRLHRAVYENRVLVQEHKHRINHMEDFCVLEPEHIFLNDMDDHDQSLSNSGYCVTNPLYKDTSVSLEDPTPASKHTNRITFVDQTVIRDYSLENSEDSGSQGSRSSLKKKKYKRGYRTEFFIAGHGPQPLSKSIALYHCKLGLTG